MGTNAIKVPVFYKKKQLVSHQIGKIEEKKEFEWICVLRFRIMENKNE
jgi:hypothetical protein